ncbi:YcxB family protein [Sphingomonas sp. PL-96]|uniref:YcxB family protein n=1 Tax=Sphingomonas sp. PL-96 TaxID=2887201 RepID=UPI001E520D77|nr:YcxB family protein [Sphingomonas sp. PL-96]MCC2977622.1 YcxB family protein [Sphingomonas sp. PL-96]
MAGIAAFTLSADDYVSMQRTVFVRQLRSRRFAIRLSLLQAAVLTASLLFFVMAGEPLQEAAWLGVLTLLAGTIGLSIVIGGHFLLLPRRARRLFTQQRMLHHPVEVTWDSAGICWRTPHGVTTYPWNQYIAWQRTPRLFLLYASDLVLYAVPTQALDMQAEEDLAQAAAAGGLPQR